MDARWLLRPAAGRRWPRIIWNWPTKNVYVIRKSHASQAEAKGASSNSKCAWYLGNRHRDGQTSSDQDGNRCSETRSSRYKAVNRRGVVIMAVNDGGCLQMSDVFIPMIKIHEGVELFVKAQMATQHFRKMQWT